ncbi:hypothetical protein G4X40_04115 [Rhodococcus sp. D2-41]|uniref:Uncharacterized protein n=1 Tax=Speluncibacter jeojiensis TaxID=2710754 RepID=A0A9X4M2Y2_9ACTN|nr:hypothetical protein [Rhodococcus sp. D2-41]MDG3009329.1 hypothetical protein [Rhodococcus sp. D2-41]MDG3016884.1 hypothetical protein [Corynebacteriales bacterium D3-21]
MFDIGGDAGHRRHRTRAQNRAARIHTARRLDRQRIDNATARREDHLRIMFGHSGNGDDDEPCPY